MPIPFNYSKLHFFDKNGHELMLKKTTMFGFKLNNERTPDEETEYAFIGVYPEAPSSEIATSIKSVDLMCTKVGSRYPSSFLDASVYTMYTTASMYKKDGNIIYRHLGNNSQMQFLSVKKYKSSDGEQCTLEASWNNFTPYQKSAMYFGTDGRMGMDSSDYIFPSYTFESKIEFDKVSTELVETQKIYTLVENPYKTDEYGIRKYTTVKEFLDDASTNDPASYNYIKEYCDRFKLFFFIDQRTQKDFRFFEITNDDVIWNDRHFLDFNLGTNHGNDGDGYSINIGFKGENEGFYEQPMYVCLLDTSTKKTDYPGDVYPIGEIKMSAETEGEDERYRTLFKNFGIPDVIEYDNIFRDSNTSEGNVDYQSINKHSKKMFLTYSEIFPYAGTYKALFNSLKLLGYEDIFFKEWYKEMGKGTHVDGGYISYDMNYTPNKSINSLNNKSLEERISLKKMNWISMFYKINEEVDCAVDSFGFPKTQDSPTIYTPELLLKLIYLKKWLEKYIIGINCHITDICGEGVCFERYTMPKYGSYQKVIEYTNERTVSPIVTNDTVMLIDGSANISVDISTTDYSTTIEDLYGKTFEDFSTGIIYSYKNSSQTHYAYNNFLNRFIPLAAKPYIYCGKTFELEDDNNTFEIKCKGTHNSFRFDSSTYTTGVTLLVDDNKIFFDPKDISNKNEYKNVVFKNLPIIQIEDGELFFDDNLNNYKIKKYDGSSHQYVITNNLEEYYLDDVFTIVPPSTKTTQQKRIFKLATSNIDTTISEISINLDNAYPIKSYSENVSITHVAPEDSVQTYGLRYTLSKYNAIGCFKIFGYESPGVFKSEGIHMPHTVTNIEREDALSGGISFYEGNFDYEMIINKGRFLFDDVEHNRKISLNFDIDENGSRIINVTELSTSETNTLYMYALNASTYTNRFKNNENYDYFVSMYKSNPSMAIIKNTNKKIKVFNTGEYEICTTLNDEYNNTFSVKANKKINVLSPDIDAYTFNTTYNSNNSYNVNGLYNSNINTKIKNMISNSCCFEYTPKFPVKNVNVSKGEIEIYNDTKYEHNKQNKYVSLTPLTKNFIYAGTLKDSSDNIYYSFIRNTQTNGYSYIFDSTKILSKKTSPEEELNDFRNQTDNNINDGITSPAACYLLSYSVSSEFPELCVPGEFIFVHKDKGRTSKLINEFRFLPYKKSIDIEEKINKYISTNKEAQIYIIPTWCVKANIDQNKIDILKSDYIYKPLPNLKVLFKTHNNVTPSLQNKYGQSSIKNIQWMELFGSYSGYMKEYLNGGNNSYISISQPVGEYVNLMMELNSFTDSSIYVTNTQGNKQILKNIDECFVASLREFDITEAQNNWLDSSLNVSSKIYYYNVPINTPDRKVLIIPNLMEIFPSWNLDYIDLLTSKKITCCWKVYKRIADIQKMLLKSYSTVLSLDLQEKGDYDIELNVYDDCGNKYTKYLNGVVSIQ